MRLEPTLFISDPCPTLLYPTILQEPTLSCISLFSNQFQEREDRGLLDTFQKVNENDAM
jgi:hypothetical protein